MGPPCKKREIEGVECKNAEGFEPSLWGPRHPIDIVQREKNLLVEATFFKTNMRGQNVKVHKDLEKVKPPTQKS